MTLSLDRPHAPDAWAEARSLIEAYAGALGIDLSFQNFAAEIQRLESVYGAPHGEFLIARLDGRAVGCAGLRRLSAEDAEMKRLYVLPAARGRGVGRALATELVVAAGRLGYRRVLLDTLPTMTGAITLYRELGFQPIEPYRFNPVPGTVFLAREVRR